MQDWGWNYEESFGLGAGQSLLSMRLLGILFIAIEIGIDQVLGRFLFCHIPNPCRRAMLRHCRFTSCSFPETTEHCPRAPAKASTQQGESPCQA